MGAPRDEFFVGEYSDIEVQVTLTQPFLMGQTEVTREQWASVGFEQPVYVSPGDGPSKCTEPECPVDTVTFEDAASFANRLSEKQGLPPC
jgi:formylglycine-generating enzyme required for sulfatase activity